MACYLGTYLVPSQSYAPHHLELAAVLGYFACLPAYADRPADGDTDTLHWSVYGSRNRSQSLLLPVDDFSQYQRLGAVS